VPRPAAGQGERGAAGGGTERAEIEVSRTHAPVVDRRATRLKQADEMAEIAPFA
jgi:hypothetical protein